MAGKKTDNSSHFHGTAQRDRLLHALLPNYVEVDERSIGEHLAFASRYAAFLQYFNENNQPIGDWSAILDKDEVVLLANITIDSKHTQDDQIRDLIHRIIHLREEDHETKEVSKMEWEQSAKKDLFTKLFVAVITCANQVDQWFKTSTELNKRSGRSLLLPILTKAIEEELAEGLQLLCNWTDLLKERNIDFPLPENTYASFSDLWGLVFASEKATAKTLRYIPVDTSQEIILNLLLEDLRKVYQKLKMVRIYVTERAPNLLQDSLRLYDDHPPDLGLLLAFFDLLGFAQDQLNTLTQRHLDYYFSTVLQQEEKTPKPDWTIIQFSLADGILQHHLPKESRLLADVNENGVPSHYETTEDLIITPVRVSSLKTIHVCKNPLVGIGSSYRLISDIYTAPVANSRDGLGQAFLDSRRGWPIFGEDQMLKAQRERQMIGARLGFVIASPVLRLDQSQRIISIHLKVTDNSRRLLQELIMDIGDDYEQVFGRLFGEALLIYASGPEGWFEIEKYLIQPDNSAKGDVVIRIPLDIDQPPIVINSPAAAEDHLDTSLPLLKMIVDGSAPVYPYSFLNELELEAVIIEAQVFEVKKLALYNDLGQVDPSAPFLPFGSIPQKGSYLLIGNVEIFSKPIKELSININWGPLPDDENGWKTYYEGYPSELDNESYQVQLTALSNYRFKPVNKEEQQSFSLFSSDAPDGPLKENTEITELDLMHLSIAPDYHLEELPEYNNTIRSGYLKIQLSEPSIMFGHKIYPRLLSDALINNTNPKKKEEIPIPNEPYNPLIKDIYLDYRSETKINLDEAKFRENDVQADEKIFHLHPFGIETIYSKGKATKDYLLPHFEYEGYLYIGLEDLRPPQWVQLFFELEESTKRSSSAPLEMSWSYLQRNKWMPLGQEEMIADETENFTTSGIVKIAIPEFISKDNTVLPAGLHWLRVAARGNLQIIGRAYAVTPNAVRVRWLDNGDLNHYSPQLELPKLEQLVQPAPEIAELRQLIGFQGRYPLESKTAFYVRTSERLRHKNRGVDRWDLERLILERFPHVQQVKCIGPSALDNKDVVIKAGEVYLAVVPKVDGMDTSPRLGFNFLQDIRDFVQTVVSPFVQLKVINPNYETLKIACSVLLEKGLYPLRGQYLQQLHKDISDYICPWLNGDGALEMGGNIRKTDLFNFISSLPYVAFVTRFSIAQIFEDETGSYEILDTARAEHDRDLIESTTPWSVLIPVGQHQITFVEVGSYEEPEITAIESMRMETDFVVLLNEDHTGVADPGLQVEEDEDLFVPPEEDESTDWFLMVGK